MTVLILKDEQRDRFGGVIRPFPEISQKGMDVVSLSDISGRLSKGSYKFISFYRMSKEGWVYGGLIISTLILDYWNTGNYTHREIARAVKIDRDDCFGGVLNVDEDGICTLHTNYGQALSVRQLNSLSGYFQAAFARTLEISEDTGVCLVDPSYLAQLDLEFGSP